MLMNYMPARTVGKSRSRTKIYIRLHHPYLDWSRKYGPTAHNQSALHYSSTLASKVKNTTPVHKFGEPHRARKFFSTHTVHQNKNRTVLPRLQKQIENKANPI